MVLESSHLSQAGIGVGTTWQKVAALFVLFVSGCGEPSVADSDPRPCIDDDLRAHLGAPKTLAQGKYSDLVVCPNVTDRYLIIQEIGAQAKVIINASQPVTAVLDDQLTMGTRIAFDLNPDNETSDLSIRGQGAIYSIELVISRPEACGSSVLDPVFIVDGLQDVSVCPSGVSWVTVDGAPGQIVSYRFRSETEEAVSGNVFELRDGRYILTERLPIDAGAALSGRRVYPAGASIFIQLIGQPQDRIIVDVEVGREELPLHRIIGSIFRWSPTVTVDGLTAPVRQPYELGRFDVVDADSGLLVGTAFTDDLGQYEFSYAAEKSTLLHFVVRAEVWSPHVDIRVGPLADSDAPWSTIITTFASETQTTGIFDVDQDDPISGALHIASVAGRGLRELAPVLPPPSLLPAPLFYRWKPNAVSGCGTCFVPGEMPYIEISGSESDPDEWDDSVILHELCHYILARFSQDDSPGVRHDGSQIEPTIAWSEGFATFCASLLMANSVQLDYRITGIREIDLESMNDEVSFGTSSGEENGLISEYLVAALLWDLFDGGGEDDDGVQLELDQLMKPILGRLNTLADDLGADGPDLVDYLNGLSCDGWGDEATRVSDLRQFPFVSTMICDLEPRP